ncbi:MAG: zf-TFIIB domain-containing protein [Alphaproteobacteria bacterium]|nr:zf-TFIIB domain-containing protein [Alphaproteobacteria bacterium]
MKCPVCGDPDLVMSERQGIEIDYCPKCRGVWLDRGELDKIIERNATASAPAPAQMAAAPAAYPTVPVRPEPPRTDDRRYEGGHKPYRRKSFLEELFD